MFDYFLGNELFTNGSSNGVKKREDEPMSSFV